MAAAYLVLGMWVCGYVGMWVCVYVGMCVCVYVCMCVCIPGTRYCGWAGHIHNPVGLKGRGG